MGSRAMEQRTILITGANTGIGRSTAAALAAGGARVILACRSREKTQPVIEEIRRTTGNEDVEFLALDLDSLASVRAAAEEFLSRRQPLHILINNAGIAGQRGVTADGFEKTFGVNHLGHFVLTTMLLDRMRESAPGRIVTVSSQAHYDAKGIDFSVLARPSEKDTGLAEYAVSKLANVLFTQELARRLRHDGISTYALHPGVIASDVWRSVPTPFRQIMKLFMKSTEQGAQTSVYCATAPELGRESGRYYDGCKEKPASQYATVDLAASLWTQSEEWTA